MSFAVQIFTQQNVLFAVPIFTLQNVSSAYRFHFNNNLPKVVITDISSSTINISARTGPKAKGDPMATLFC